MTGGPIRRLRRRGIQPQAPQPVLRRTIHFVWADDQGNFNPLHWRFLEFEGQSVFNLRRDIAGALGEANNVLGLTLCAYAGSNGRLTPLVIDLPSDENIMDIVVLTTGSTGKNLRVFVFSNLCSTRYSSHERCSVDQSDKSTFTNLNIDKVCSSVVWTLAFCCEKSVKLVTVSVTVTCLA